MQTCYVTCTPLLLPVPIVNLCCKSFVVHFRVEHVEHLSPFCQLKAEGVFHCHLELIEFWTIRMQTSHAIC